MKKQTLHIFLCTKDDYYMKYCLSLLESLKRHRNPDYHYTVHILLDKISDTTKKLLDAYVQDWFTINPIEIDKDAFTPYPKMRKRDYIYVYRLFLGDYIKDVERILYIDTDIIINGDISPLFSMDLEGNIIGAVKDCVNRSTYGIHKLSRFFNSWVMLIDFKKWNKDDTGHKVLQLLNDHRQDFPMGQDQDWLNHILQGKRLAISPKRNGLNINDFSYVWTQYTKQEFKESKHPVIVHYAGNHHRPWWWLVCVHPKRYLYYYYVFKTPLREWKDVYKFPLRILTSNFITYFLYKVMWTLFAKKILARRYAKK